MRTIFHRFTDTISLAVQGWFFVLTQWKYFTLTIVMLVPIIGLLYIIINRTSVWPLLTSPLLTHPERFWLLLDFPRQALIQNGVIILAVSLIQSIALALLIYNARSAPKVDSKNIGGSLAASTIAYFGLGCSVCGTSLLIPIISLLGSVGIYAADHTVILYINSIALILGVYIMVRLGTISYAHYQSKIYRAKNQNS